MTDDPYNPELLNLQRLLAEELLAKHKNPPDPDVFDPDKYPYGKEAGANKLSIKKCPTCGKSPTDLSKTEHANMCPEGAFLFRDELSAQEYYISGICQSCQDSMFGLNEDDEEDENV